MTKIMTYRWNAISLTICVALLFLLTLATEDSALAAIRSIRQADAVTPSTPAPGANQPETTRRVRILVQPKNTIAEDQLQNVFASLDAKQEDIIQQINVRILSVPEIARDRILDALSHHANIEFAERDLIFAPDLTPNDPYYIYNYQWHLKKIAAPAAWDITTGSTSVIIAILDTGIDSTHPDLVGNLVPGWNAYDGNSDTTEVYPHGTAIAGTVAAISNNGNGVASLAWGCKILPIRISDLNGYANSAVIATGLTYAADHGARVANISFGVSASSAVAAAAQYFQSKGGVVTVSAGNQVLFDSTADNPYVLTVSATDSTDALASFSNTGNNVDLAAPGVSIVTTGGGGRYVSGTGTSMSAPIVAGVAALVISVNPSLSGEQVQDILKQNADDVGQAGWDPSFGYGRVNAYKAVLAAVGASATDSMPPSATISSPSNGSTVSGAISINVVASDDIGIAKVELYLNGSFAGTSSSAFASFTWDTSVWADGSYTLQARAYDAAGNSANSASVIVIVQNATSDTSPPAVQITSPTTGSTATKSMKVYVAASDNVGATRVDLYIDGKPYASNTISPYVFTCNTSKLARGQHNFQAFAYDAAGNLGSSMVVTVTK